MGDSGSDTDDFADGSFSFLSEISAPRNPPQCLSQLARTRPILAALLLSSPNEQPSRRNNPELMHQNPNYSLQPRTQPNYVSVDSFSSNELSPSRNSPPFRTQPNCVSDDSFSPNELSPSRNSPPFRTQLDQSSSLLMETTEAHEPSTPRLPSEEQGQIDRNDTLLSRMHASISNEASISRKRPAVARETSLSRNRPAAESEMNIDVLKGEASTPRNRPATENEIVLKGEASTSRLQPLLAESGFSFDDQPFSSSNVPQSGKPRERICGTIEPCTPIHADRYPIHAAEALVYLQSVLRQIVQFNEENDRWRRFSLQFLNDTGLSSKKHGSNLKKDLLNSLVDMKIDLPWKQGPNIPREMTVETYSLGAYETLTSMVVSALAFALTIRLNQDFDGLIFIYVSFRGLYDTFSEYWKNNNIEDIEDEASRNHLKTLKKMIDRLLLLTLTAFQFLFMYIGENADEKKIEMYEKYLSNKDKKYLRKST